MGIHFYDILAPLYKAYLIIIALQLNSLYYSVINPYIYRSLLQSSVSMIPDHLYLNQKVIIYQSNKSCPNEIINHTGDEAIIKGFKKIGKRKIMPIVEFNDRTRMWILYKESRHVTDKTYTI